MAPTARVGGSWSQLVTFPAHALLILEERLREQEAEGVKMPEGMQRDELALRILIAAEPVRLAPPTPTMGRRAEPVRL
jgi:hypothetical protein